MKEAGWDGRGVYKQKGRCVLALAACTCVLVVRGSEIEELTASL